MSTQQSDDDKDVNPSAAYPWGLGTMTSSLTIRVEAWYRTKTAVGKAARHSFDRNPVLVRWHSDGERITRRG